MAPAPVLSVAGTALCRAALEAASPSVPAGYREPWCLRGLCCPSGAPPPALCRCSAASSSPRHSPSSCGLTATRPSASRPDRGRSRHIRCAAMAAAAAHSVRVLRELNRLRAAGLFCDATLGVGGREFRAHWPVLASCSRFFRARGPGGPVALPDGLADTFQLLLDFFYTGRLALTAHNRSRLQAAAEQLGVPDAVALCRAFRPAAPRQRPRRAPVPSGPVGTPPAPEEAADGGGGRGGTEAAPEQKALRGTGSPPPGGSGTGAAAPVECPTCHKTFLSKYYLKVHNRKHTGEKPFECSKCGKCYFRKENLQEHEARNCMNRSEQAFTCSVCQEVFKRRVELRLHMVSHTGDMPYKCSSCAQQFMQKKDLQSHMIKLHGAPKPHASCACTRPSSTAERSCLCARSVGTGPRAAMGCRCTSRPSTGTSGPTCVSSATMPSPRKPTSTCTCARTRARSPSSATCVARPSGHKRAWTSTTGPTPGSARLAVSSASSASPRRGLCCGTWPAGTRRGGPTSARSAARPSKPSSSSASTSAGTGA
ncbi:telomere zinc finger-associated protein isoform X3 [Melopsittacus undulatus]|uniref:telomere zinc finger-associated protein isoform X3 n=1 Tax=Melopsittacus undulatus TaxID=13146 RepID=UPI00146AEBFB|nr:telomere zinc finger-associated protein isoform X3 [Melopsittacus undulatus]